MQSANPAINAVTVDLSESALEAAQAADASKDAGEPLGSLHGVPTGVVDGLPTGVQIVGRKFREDQCLDAAQAVEDAVGTFAEKLWT